MLNVKEATELLWNEGITNNEQVVIRWILQGKLKAKRTKNLNIDYIIKPTDLAAFILEKKIEKRSSQFGVDYHQWEKTFYENQQLKEENEALKSKVRIEQTKVRGLKRMLQAEYALTDSPPLTYCELLGLEPDADKELIKKEFKKILKALHPDRGGDDRLFRVFYEHYTKTK
ncbi:J domain-containing protein [Neobacillus sp. WH10]|uniref:J domain-containing protein n=1 Tax=Neobacillus sp. WH10 TaxID=3047873 RepID=UPI0024C1F9D6|nr:J domain-containing protein [Neobacillus sp. WH10]WHY79815.1 J domain-containing protein [Neobacillus sp. WH10]